MRGSCVRLLWTFVLALFDPTLPTGLAQLSMAGHVMELQDELPPEKLPPAARMAGIGNAELKITAAAEAQSWFNQGLNLLHDFWDYEAARAFEQGVRADAHCAMCYWGLYKAESFYHSTAKGFAGQALARAVSLKDQVSIEERLYIEAAAAGEESMHSADAATLRSREQELLRRIVAENPHDVQARIFLADAGVKDSIDILESVLRDDPENAAANHYYMHALEGSDHPEKALRSAEIVGRLAPASGHMVHMPGHIYFRLGDYRRAAEAFAASLAVDERYMREQHVDPDNDWNYVHNLMYSVANLLEQGKLEEATHLSAKITDARGKFDTTLYTNSARDSMSRLNAQLPVAVRTGDFRKIRILLNASRVPQDLPNLEFLRLRLLEFASAMQALAAGDLSEAGRLSTRYDAELWRAAQGYKDSADRQHMMPLPSPMPAPATPKIAVMPDALLEPLLKTLSIMSLELRGSLLACRGKTDDAKALFANAAKEEKALGYREPPHYIRPVGETEGEAMMAARKWADARAAFERSLAQRPHSGFALYGIALSFGHAGDRVAALKAYSDFVAAWKEADPGLPQLTHALSYLGAKRR